MKTIENPTANVANEVVNQSIVTLTDNERTVLEALYKSAKETGDSGIEYILENVSAEMKKVGDLHKNGKWVWTEYAPGKFDWRTRPELKQRPGAKAKAGEESTKKGKPAKKAASKASTVKTPVKNTETKMSDEPNQKLLTIDEWIALPNKRSIVAKKISDAQKEAFKLIMKGYRLTSDMKFFENGESRKSCKVYKRCLLVTE